MTHHKASIHVRYSIICDTEEIEAYLSESDVELLLGLEDARVPMETARMPLSVSVLLGIL